MGIHLMEEVQEFHGQNYMIFILKHYRKHNVYTIPTPISACINTRVGTWCAHPSHICIYLYTHLCLDLYLYL